MMPEKNRESNDPYYDIVEDYDLIVSSMMSQYGIRMYDKSFKDMSWMEFCALIAGLGPDTPLGRIVSIRAEEDEDVLKHFSKEQKRIRNTWLQRKAKEKSQDELDDVVESLKQAFIYMAGGVQDASEY